MNEFSPQIPLDLFEPEPPSFANFIVGVNEELLTRLYAVATHAIDDQQLYAVTSVWSGRPTGKTHLLLSLRDTLTAQSKRICVVEANAAPLDSPFDNYDALLIDDADQLNDSAQAFAFNAFNHVLARGGVVLSTGKKPVTQWPIRDDLRTRLASGVSVELLGVSQDELPQLLAEYAERQRMPLSKEVLTFLLTHTERDVGKLAQLISALDRLSLSSKRSITIPLVKAFLARSNGQISR